MFYLFKYDDNGVPFCLGPYNTLVQCERATEIAWDILQKMGCDRAQYYCTEHNLTNKVAAWIYIGGGENV